MMSRTPATPAPLTSRAKISFSRLALLRSKLPTLLVFLCLAGLAYWGYRTEWKIPGFSSDRRDSRSENEAAEGAETTSNTPRVIAPETADKLCPLNRTRIEMPSAAVIGRAGIRVVPVQREPLTATLKAPSEVGYDPTLVARLSSPVPGRAWRVETEVGDRVRKGDLLVLLDAAKVGDAKAEFLQALTQRNLKSQILENMSAASDAVAKRRIREAEADLRDSSIRLFNTEQALVNLGLPMKAQDLVDLSNEDLAARVRYFGLPESVMKALDPATATSNLLPVRAPFDGLVAERQISVGEVVETSQTLFVVADVSRLWLLMGVRQEDADKLAIGQKVSFGPDGHSDETFPGEISWISTTVDEKSRTLRARAVVDNPQGHLRPGMFGAARIIIRDQAQTLAVPAEAVQREGRCRFVFVRLSDQAFEVRQVQLGISNGVMTEILEGLKPGEVVATTGSLILKSEILKGRLGADAD